MALGPCTFLTCRSALGTEYRAMFRGGPARKVDGSVFGAMLLCPEHERLCDELRRGRNGALMVSPEGWVYPAAWMDGLGFLV